MAVVDETFGARLDEIEKRLAFVERFLESATVEDEPGLDPIELRHQMNLQRLRDQ